MWWLVGICECDCIVYVYKLCLRLGAFQLLWLWASRPSDSLPKTYNRWSPHCKNIVELMALCEGLGRLGYRAHQLQLPILTVQTDSLFSINLFCREIPPLHYQQVMYKDGQNLLPAFLSEQLKNLGTCRNRKETKKLKKIDFAFWKPFWFVILTSNKYNGHF